MPRPLLPLLALAASAALAAEPAPLSLERAVALSLGSSPETRAAEADRDAAAARLRQARSAWLPELVVSESWTEGDHPVWVFGTLLEQGRFGAEHFDPAFLNDPPSLENYRASLTIRAPLFDQLRRVSRIAQARVGLDAARAGAAGTAQRRIFDTLSLYDAAVLAQARREVAAQSVRSAEADLEAIRERVAAGLLVESDLLAAEVHLAERIQRRIEAEGEEEAARAALLAAVGLPGDAAVELTGFDGFTPPPPPPLEELRGEVESRRADLVGAELARRAAALETRIARASRLPRLDAFATFGASGASFDETSSDTVYGMVLTLPLLQPGREGRVAEARALERRAGAEADRAARDASVEIVSAHRRYLAAREALEVAERAVASASESLRIVRDRYEAGLTTITELLRAGTALDQARLQLLAARSRTRVGLAALLLAAGRLDSIESFGGNA